MAGSNGLQKNLGAETIYDGGLYFQWADTQGYTAAQVGNGEGQKPFTYSDCIYHESYGAYTKYISGNPIVLTQEDDAVYTAWGGNWRMPTNTELETLKNSVTVTRVTDYNGSGVSGHVFTDNNDSSKVLFFPDTGHCTNSNRYNTDKASHIWSKVLRTGGSDVGNAYSMNILTTSNTSVNISRNSRHYGYNCRGVLDDAV